MALKPGPKRIAKSTGKPDRRAIDNKDTLLPKLMSGEIKINF